MGKLTSRIIRAGLIVGTLDITSAFIYYMIKSGKSDFWVVLKFVASGAFGKSASIGGGLMIALGLVFHYIIAFSFTILFFLLYPKLAILSKNRIIAGIVYGLFIWAFMNLVVVPLSNVVHRLFNPVNMLINMAILVVLIGIPLSFMANAYYRKIKTG
jgi:hypothetical protein